ncbi:cardiolipin synthase [Paenibacillus soyae]|uniref:Cardiolipin synthase n=1 Tax=Paenibacillus soyae TaxID=2969249 RepID=A0A9X2SBY4_9BACL|nr:cardiolipin synthase [Paenibacillus soyae]MCR2806138.1 cardiolipin synthase [Paenibacillus soyae]
MVSWLGWLLALYVVQFAAILLLEHRRQGYMTAWLFITFVCPFIGFAAYFLVGRRKRQSILESRTGEAAMEERIAAAAAKAEIVETSGWGDQSDLGRESRLQQALAMLSPFPVTGRNRTKVLRNGDQTFDAMMDAMRSARHHIHMDYYTIRHVGVGKLFLDLLAEKARKGIEVRLLYDGIGSLNLDEGVIRALREAGAETCCFAPPKAAFLERRLNYRNHRKIAVIDGRVGFLGGINIGDEYLGMDEKIGYWRDTHLSVHGDAVYYLQALFMQDWQRASGKHLPLSDVYMPKHGIQEKERVMIVPGKPGVNDREIVEVMFAAMAAARTRIYAATPYFIPDPAIAMSLRVAARSGVDVKLIIPGIPDTDLVLLATLSYVQDMLEAGVRVYRYWKGFIHAKVLIVDDMLASVGTANLDMRSLYSNYESIALVFDEKPIRSLERDFEEDLKACEELELERFARRPRKQKAAEAVMHMLSPLL